MALFIAAPKVYFCPMAKKESQREMLSEYVQHQRQAGNIVI